MTSTTEFDYHAIRLVVRGAKVIPPITGLLGFVLVALAGLHAGEPLYVVAGVVVGPLLWFLARLLVEIVAVIADTLLPR